MSLQGSKGEVMFDNRADGKGVQEYWTFTCAHCGTVRYVNPGTGNIIRMRVINKITPQEDGTSLVEPVEIQWREIDPPIVCIKCMKYLCDNPTCHKDCLPVEAGIDLILSKGVEVSPFATDERSRFELQEQYATQRIFPAGTPKEQ